MKALRSAVFGIALMAAVSAGARADNAPTAPTDKTDYKQKLHDCQTQMKTDHPDMNHDARRQACRKQLGPMPKSAPAPATPELPVAPGAAVPAPTR